MTELKQTDVIIIGAGITGLVTAYYLKKQGLQVKVLEKNNHIGGVIRTFQENGFTFEAGPNTGVVSHPEVAEIFEELADHCQLEVADPAAKRRLIWKSDQWHALPGGLVSAIRTPLFSTRDKFRILGEPFRRKGSDPYESVAGLVLRRLGKSYLQYAVDPFISGVYAGDPSKLITRFALPKLYALEQNYGSFIKGAVKKGFEPRDPRMKKATREVFSAKNGLGSLIQALGKALGEEQIILEAEQVAIEPQTSAYRVQYSHEGNTQVIETKFVVSTADAQALPALMPFLSNEQLSPVTSLTYARVTQVILGFKNWQGTGLNAFGGLVPTVENRNILGVLFTSSFFQNRAPQNGALLSVFMGGTKRPDLITLSDEEIKSIVYKEVREMMQLHDIRPDVFRIFRYDKAIPQYERSSEERFKAISDIQEAFPGLILGGGMRDGIGMADRIKQAVTIANDIINASHH